MAALKVIRKLQPFELIAIDTLIKSLLRLVPQRALLKRCYYGSLRLIQSNQGHKYVNSIIQSLMNWFQVRHNQTLAWLAYGQIERADRSIIHHLRCLVFEKEVTTT